MCENNTILSALGRMTGYVVLSYEDLRSFPRSPPAG
jgi:hypothetical protein